MLTIAIGLIAALVIVLVTANIMGTLAQLRRENKELRERLWMYRIAAMNPDIVTFRYSTSRYDRQADGSWRRTDINGEEIDCDLSDLDGVNSPS
jgi:hypothetical protein